MTFFMHAYDHDYAAIIFSCSNLDKSGENLDHCVSLEQADSIVLSLYNIWIYISQALALPAYL